MHTWEEIEAEQTDATYRMRVPGGWLYRYAFLISYDDKGDSLDGHTMVFVPLAFEP